MFGLSKSEKRSLRRRLKTFFAKVIVRSYIFFCALIIFVLAYFIFIKNN